MPSSRSSAPAAAAAITPASPSTSVSSSDSVLPIEIEMVATESNRGRPISGRVWKEVAVKNSTMKSGILSKTWAKRLQIRQDRDTLLRMTKEIKDEKKATKEAKRKAMEDRRVRKEENERKAEIVQKISAAKLRRMKKRQLKGLVKK